MRVRKFGSIVSALVVALHAMGTATGCSGEAGSDATQDLNHSKGGKAASSGGSATNPIGIPSSGGAPNDVPQGSKPTGGSVGTSGGRPTANGGSGGSGANGANGGKASDAQGGEKACSAETREGRRAPLDMYFLVDSSGSMADEVDGGTKWELVSSALVDFLESPSNADLGVGIGYFPSTELPDCSQPGADCVCYPFSWSCFSDSGGSCSAADYEEPAVELALSSRTQAVITDLLSHDVDGSTPTRPALEGAVKYLSAWAEAHPERKTVVVLATDGEPTECDANTPTDVAEVARRALASHPSIQTFVIGVGDSLGSLDVVARAGGTERAYLVDPRTNLASSFAEALSKVRGAAASCDFVIPTAGSGGQKVDPKKVNVRLTVNGVPTRLTQTFDNDPANCGSDGGWYFDNPAAPSQIRLCESTCQALSDGSIEVEFGCDTLVQPPR